MCGLLEVGIRRWGGKGYVAPPPYKIIGEGGGATPWPSLYASNQALGDQTSKTRSRPYGDQCYSVSTTS